MQIDLIIFSILNIHFGVMADQVIEMYNEDKIEDKGHETIFFHKKLFLDNKTEITYKSPKILLISENNKILGIIVEKPKKFIKVNKSEIYSIPKLIKLHQKSLIIWGCTFYENKIVLLVDFKKLIKY